MPHPHSKDGTLNSIAQDSLQAFSSSIAGMLSSRAVLQGNIIPLSSTMYTFNMRIYARIRGHGRPSVPVGTACKKYIASASSLGGPSLLLSRLGTPHLLHISKKRLDRSVAMYTYTHKLQR
jgi:hypothetical protein